MPEPRFDIESDERTATLHVRRPLAIADLGDGCLACASLPAAVRQLSIDAESLEPGDLQTREVLRELSRFWTRLRGGTLESCGSERLVDIVPGMPAASMNPATLLVPEDAALTGVFL